MENAIERAAAICGGLKKLSVLMGEKSVQVVCNWRDRQVPLDKCVRIEELTNKKVRRWDLRPDDWHLMWPELRNRRGAPAIKDQA